MPLPLIPVLIALGTATAVSVKKGYDAYSDSEAAKEYYEKGQKLAKKSQENLQAMGEKVQNELEELARFFKVISDDGLTRYMHLIDKLEIGQGSKMLVDFQREWEEVSVQVRDTQKNLEVAFNKGLASGVTCGAIAGFGAYNAVMALGAASTGAALSGLKGAAAVNATLAWFGGGSLATGGLGMAGGMYVLGGIVAAPVILITSFWVASEMEKNKYDAKAFCDEMRAYSNSLDLQYYKWKEIYNKATEKKETLKLTYEEFDGLLRNSEDALNRLGCYVSEWSDEEQSNLKKTMQFAQTIANAINGPLIDDAIQADIMSLQEKSEQLLSKIQKRWGQK